MFLPPRFDFTRIAYCDIRHRIGPNRINNDGNGTPSSHDASAVKRAPTCIHIFGSSIYEIRSPFICWRKRPFGIWCITMRQKAQSGSSTGEEAYLLPMRFQEASPLVALPDGNLDG